jgi:hypothetical protein
MEWEGNGKSGRVGECVGKGEKKGIGGSGGKRWEIIKHIEIFIEKCR